MYKNNISLYFIYVIFLGFTTLFFNSCTHTNDFSAHVKVALRVVGHQLLIADKDSTSLVLPITEITKNEFQIPFQNPLAITPDNLITTIQNSIQKAKLPKYYRVEVINCTNKEVVYSYEKKATKQNSIIPCKGRLLPKNCYQIHLKFINIKTTSNNTIPYLVVLFIVLLVIIKGVFNNKKKAKQEVNNGTDTNKLTLGNYNSIGVFKFYPEENKLIKEAIEIKLSKKECELLTLFIAQPNQVIKREELTQKIWEDNGVFVGRNLDTYVSKLRKILKEDTSIKITNVHGVGYKLEI